MKRSLVKYLAEGGELGSLFKRGKKGKASEPFPCEPAQVFEKQVVGLVTRLRRIKVKAVVLGLSGGLDSALALLVAYEAFLRLKLPLSGLSVMALPGYASSRRTRVNANKLVSGLGLKLEVIDISAAVTAHLRLIGHDGKTPDVTYENAQARMRTLILMNRANMLGAIVLGTGDLSEIALGWCTYNADHMSMFAVNNNVPKTVVRQVVHWWAQRQGGKAAEALADILATPISPELIKGQKTEDKLGPYELHDYFLWNFIMNGLDRKALSSAAKARYRGVYSAKLIDATLRTFLVRLVTQAFKRNCQPDGIKVFPFELSPKDWSIPSDLPWDALL